VDERLEDAISFLGVDDLEDQVETEHVDHDEYVESTLPAGYRAEEVDGKEVPVGNSKWLSKESVTRRIGRFHESTVFALPNMLANVPMKSRPPKSLKQVGDGVVRADVTVRRRRVRVVDHHCSQLLGHDISDSIVVVALVEDTLVVRSSLVDEE